MSGIPTPVIKTNRLILRVPTLADVDKIQAAKEEVWSELQNWMSWASDAEGTIEAARNYIIKHETDFNPDDFPLIGFNPLNNDFIISTGVHTRGEKEYGTGYWIAKKYLGQGYATEATNAILRYLFTAKKAIKVHIEHFAGNDKSENVIKKLGFKLDKIDQKQAHQFSTGIKLDHYRYIRTDFDDLPDLEVSWT